MQSAIDTCVHVVEIVKGESWNPASASIKMAADYLRARDREIVEACKDAVIKAYDGSGRLRNHRAQIAALDLVLQYLV